MPTLLCTIDMYMYNVVYMYMYMYVCMYMYMYVNVHEHCIQYVRCSDDHMSVTCHTSRD